MESFWHTQSPLPRYPTLYGKRYADVAVVGGGMAGLLTAYFLKESGAQVIVLEQNRLAQGVTGSTTAKITAQHGSFAARLLRDFGTQLGRQYMLANLAAVEQYQQLVERLEVSCDFSRRDCYLFATGQNALLREAEAASWLDAPAQFLREPQLPIPAATAVCFPRQAQFRPLPFLAALLPALEIYERSRVTDIRGERVRTDHGEVRAKHIVVATHFPFLNRHGLYMLRLHQVRSYVLALQAKDVPPDLYLDAGEDGWTLRSCGDSHILLGKTGRRTGENVGDNFAALHRQAKLWFPEAAPVTAWATQDCMSADGIPYIGQYAPTTPRLWVATGFGAWGMTGSMVAASILSAELTGQHYPYADIFSPRRLPLFASAHRMGQNVSHAVRGLLRHWQAPERKSVCDIPPDHAGVVRVGGKKLGVYRRPDGRYFAVSLRCPHLGCALRWNDEEKSWDCPCHGSRFNYLGKCIENPAQKSIAVTDIW